MGQLFALADPFGARAKLELALQVPGESEKRRGQNQLTLFWTKHSWYSDKIESVRQGPSL
jgi:hypothetical protein